jgi:hypothetical protein
MASSRTSTRVGLGVGIFLLALATAAIHLYLGLSFGGNTLFVLNGLGYLGLLAALQLRDQQLSPYRPIVRWVLVGYTTALKRAGARDPSLGMLITGRPPTAPPLTGPRSIPVSVARRGPKPAQNSLRSSGRGA